MKKGFIFGKFYPFHNGHQAMINFALTQGSEIKVLVCAEKYETIPGEVRANWIRDTFKDDPRVQVEVFNYKDSDYPSTSEADLDISRKWSRLFSEKFLGYNFFVTSEAYGTYIESFTGFRHIMFDQARSGVNISASTIRSDMRSNWSYLPSSVQKHFQLKIVIGGTESTGKTTMIQKLNESMPDSIIIGEAGRDVVDSSKTVTINELKEILIQHNQKITDANVTKPIVLIDTDYNTTVSYAYFKFDVKLVPYPYIPIESKCDLYLYLNKNVPFIQDGTRFDLKDRDALDKSHRFILNQNRIKYTEIDSEGYDERFHEAQKKIQNLIDSRLQIV